MINSHPEMRPGVLRIAVTVFTPFACGYFLSYLYRTVNAVIADDLTASIAITPSQLGLLTSAYFITFAAFQLPLGILLDRYGPRRVESALLVFAAAGAAMFGLAGSIAGLAAGRALIGLGVSACLMAALKANIMWWPKERLPLVNGLFMAVGGMGAIVATTPVAALLTVTDWRGLFLGLAVLTAGVAALIFLVVPEPPGRAMAQPSLRAQIRGIADVFTSPFFWKVAPACVMLQSTFLAYIGLWAGPWFRDVEGMDRNAVATHLQYTALAMVAGFMTLGAIADRLGRLGVRPLTVAGGGMALCLAAQAVLVFQPHAAPALMWVGFAFLGSASVMGYAILSQAFPAEMGGRVNTALNMLVFVVAFALQAAVGAIIGLMPGGAGEGYGALGHRVALGAVLLLETLSMIWFVWPRRAALPHAVTPVPDTGRAG